MYKKFYLANIIHLEGTDGESTPCSGSEPSFSTSSTAPESSPAPTSSSASFENEEDSRPSLNIELADSNIAVCSALTFEKLIARGFIGERFLMMLHGINLACLLVVPVVVINKKHEFIGPGEMKKDRAKDSLY